MSLLILCPQQLSLPSMSPKLVIWNVGQGQWVSLVHEQACYHFDLGGEQFPSTKSLKDHCLHKLNFALFSHWDWDHIRLARKALKQLPNLCVALAPKGLAQANKRAFLSSLKACTPTKTWGVFRELSFQAQELSSNAQSRVFQIAQRILNPADSGTKQEARWVRDLQNTDLIDLLIVGHHGSKTSTSDKLLKQLGGLRQAVISARYQRYKHPHWSVEARLRAYGVSPLRTEDWGNIHLEMGYQKAAKTYFGE